MGSLDSYSQIFFHDRARGRVRELSFGASKLLAPQRRPPPGGADTSAGIVPTHEPARRFSRALLSDRDGLRGRGHRDHLPVPWPWTRRAWPVRWSRSWCRRFGVVRSSTRGNGALDWGPVKAGPPGRVGARPNLVVDSPAYRAVERRGQRGESQALVGLEDLNHNFLTGSLEELSSGRAALASGRATSALHVARSR